MAVALQLREDHIPVGNRYVPAPIEQVEGMLIRVAKKGDRHVDLGCGEGFVVAAGLALGLDSHGCEIQDLLFNAAASKFPGRVSLLNWKSVNLSVYDLVTVYCSEESGAYLLEKARREMRSGSRFVTFYGFPKFEVI